MKLVKIHNLTEAKINWDSMSEQDQIYAVSGPSAFKIQHIKNPSEKVQMAAVRGSLDVLKFKFIKNPSDNVLAYAVSQDYTYIKSIKDPTPNVQIAAYKGIIEKQAISMVVFMVKAGYTSPEVLEPVINQSPEAIAFLFKAGIKKFPPEVLSTALTNEKFIKSGKYMEFIKEYFKTNALLMNKWLRYAENTKS